MWRPLPRSSPATTPGSSPVSRSSPTAECTRGEKVTQATMHAVQAQEAGAPFVNVELPVPEPKPGQVRVKVHACGICGGDEIPREGLFGTQLPRVPGHEIGGVVDAVGDGVTMWQVGDPGGGGWCRGTEPTPEIFRAGDVANYAH